jgi:acetolactate synthase-1/2/3 large subunit
MILRQVMGPEDIAISDVGAHKMWIARHYHSERPNTCIISNGFAAMGIRYPWSAMAAKLVHPESQSCSSHWRRGFYDELCKSWKPRCALVRLLSPLMFNDGGYGLIEWKQQSPLCPPLKRQGCFKVPGKLLG